MQELEIS